MIRLNFSYNSFHSNIGMAPFETLYRKACRTSLCWSEVGERPLVGPEMVEETTQNVQVIKANMEVAQDQQKSLADRHATDRVYKVSDWVFFKLSPWKGVVRLLIGLSCLQSWLECTMYFTSLCFVIMFRTLHRLYLLDSLRLVQTCLTRKNRDDPRLEG